MHAYVSLLAAHGYFHNARGIVSQAPTFKGKKFTCDHTEYTFTALNTTLGPKEVTPKDFIAFQVDIDGEVISVLSHTALMAAQSGKLKAKKFVDSLDFFELDAAGARSLYIFEGATLADGFHGWPVSIGYLLSLNEPKFNPEKFVKDLAGEIEETRDSALSVIAEELRHNFDFAESLSECTLEILIQKPSAAKSYTDRDAYAVLSKGPLEVKVYKDEKPVCVVNIVPPTFEVKLL